MNRRAFFGTMVGGVAASAALRTFPFRVYSFPTDIKIASAGEFPAWMYAAESYLFNPESAEERARFMGMVEKEKQGFNLVRGGMPGKAYPQFFREEEKTRLFSDVELAQVDWA